MGVASSPGWPAALVFACVCVCGRVGVGCCWPKSSERGQKQNASGWGEANERRHQGGGEGETAQCASPLSCSAPAGTPGPQAAESPLQREPAPSSTPVPGGSKDGGRRKEATTEESSPCVALVRPPPLLAWPPWPLASCVGRVGVVRVRRLFDVNARKDWRQEEATTRHDHATPTRGPPPTRATRCSTVARSSEVGPLHCVAGAREPLLPVA